MWVALAVLSALCLGCYDVSKKRSLDNNNVADVLLFSLLISSALLLLPLMLSRWIVDKGLIDIARVELIYVPHVGGFEHILIFLKSCLVLLSWICTYVAIKHLPLSVVSPMQATRPMWTLLGALMIFGEVLNGWQWLGVVCALGSIFVFSIVEHRSLTTSAKDKRYYWFLVMAVILGSASGLYDKYMMQRIDHNAVQVYYTFYQSLLMLICWLVRRKYLCEKAGAFHWRWEVAAISVFLILSDYVYLLALTYPESLIAIVSTIRRSGTIIPFLYGILYLREAEPKKKIICLSGVVLGLAFLLLGSL